MSEESEGIEALLKALRWEYADGCRDRRNLDRYIDHWKLQAESTLPTSRVRELFSILRPLLRGYATLSMGERQHTIVSVGQQLKARLPNPNAETSGESSAPKSGHTTGFPPAGKPTMDLEGDVKFLKGVGPQAGARLHKLGIRTVYELIMHLPRRWEDRSTFRTIAELRSGAVETVRGTLGPFRTQNPKPGVTVVKAPLSDATGSLWLTWFNQPHIGKGYTVGEKLTATGKVELSFSEWQMSSPEVEKSAETVHAGRIVPVYPLTNNVQQKWVRRVQYQAVPTYAPKLIDPLPESVIQRHGFPGKAVSVLEMHWPRNFELREKARRRLAYEELFFLQMELVKQKQNRELEPRTLEYPQCLNGELIERFLEILPFPPTGAQSRLFREIQQDLLRNTPMNRLLQGDVGSGKTVVAAFASWCAIQHGYQAAIMAPTEILSEQHAIKLDAMLAPLGIVVARLSGSLKKSEKRKVCERLVAGEINLLVGTHALIQDSVEFHRLGMVVVDEQHKFGVMQRTTLRQKGENPDLLVMTATPIPRTLALTLYGDLEVSRLDELPPGRQPIISESVPFSERRRVYEEIRDQINEGRQAYIICPLIEENEMVEATAAVEEAGVLQTKIFPEFKVGLLHGRMKGSEKEAIMEAFRCGELHILISTTVIEVGVDVPNATFMLVQDANRFGLAQLHQLRGRVGRGKHASRCVFMGDTRSQESAKRLRAIAKLSDGFEVAEEDLQIRGPGDYYGLRQSGFPEFKVADLLRDQDLLALARKDCQAILEADPDLLAPEHSLLKNALEQKTEKVAELVH